MEFFLAMVGLFLFVCLVFAVILLEDWWYYRNHPDKERPDVSMWP